MFGDIANFESHKLLTNFYGREFHPESAQPSALIYDEVDTLIDNADRTLYISHHIDDLEKMRDIFVAIWAAVHNPMTYPFTETNVNKVQNGLAKLIVDGTEGESLSKFSVAADSSSSSSSSSSSDSEQKKLYIPGHLLDYVFSRLKTWVNSAYHARDEPEDTDYIIIDPKEMQQMDASTREALKQRVGGITPVDKTTGVEQLSTTYTNGFQQFLQLKHHAALSHESLKAIFVSNHAYIRDSYPVRFGMSGTLGNQQERRVVYRDEFGASTFSIPRFQHREYEQLDPIIATDQNTWEQEIVRQVLVEVLGSGARNDESPDAAATGNGNATGNVQHHSKRQLARLQELAEDQITRQGDIEHMHVLTKERRHQFELFQQGFLATASEIVDQYAVLEKELQGVEPESFGDSSTQGRIETGSSTYNNQFDKKIGVLANLEEKCTHLLQELPISREHSTPNDILADAPQADPAQANFDSDSSADSLSNEWSESCSLSCRPVYTQGRHAGGRAGGGEG